MNKKILILPLISLSFVLANSCEDEEGSLSEDCQCHPSCICHSGSSICRQCRLLDFGSIMNDNQKSCRCPPLSFMSGLDPFTCTKLKPITLVFFQQEITQSISNQQLINKQQEDKLASLNEKFTELKQDKLTLNQQLTQLNQDQLTLNDEITKQKQDKHSLNEELALLKQDKLPQNEKLTNLNQNQQALNQEFEQLKQDKLSLNQELASLKQDKLTQIEILIMLNQDQQTLIQKFDKLKQDKKQLNDIKTIDQNRSPPGFQNTTKNKSNETSSNGKIGMILAIISLVMVIILIISGICKYKQFKEIIEKSSLNSIQNYTSCKIYDFENQKQKLNQKQSETKPNTIILETPKQKEQQI